MLIIYLLLAFSLFVLLAGIIFFYLYIKKKEDLIHQIERNFELDHVISELEEKVQIAIQDKLNFEQKNIILEQDLKLQILASMDLKAIVEYSHNFIFTLNRNGNFKRANNLVINRLGYSLKELLDLNFSYFISENELDWYSLFLLTSSTLDKFYQVELINRFGEKILVGLQFTKQVDVDGSISGIICIGFEFPKTSEPIIGTASNLNFDKILEITEGDLGFMANLFQSYFNSLEECKSSFANHIQSNDLQGLKFLLHKIRATTKTFLIKSLEQKFDEAIKNFQEELLLSENQKIKLIDEVNYICAEVEREIRKFAKSNGVVLHD